MNRTEMILIESVPTTSNPNGVLSKDILSSVFALHDKMTSLASFKSLCVKQAGDSGDCEEVQSPFVLWNDDGASIQGSTQDEILDTITAGKQGFVMDAFIGKVERENDDTGGRVLAGSALQIVYWIQDLASKEEEILAYEEDEFLVLCRSEAATIASNTGAGVYCQAERSYTDESDRAIADDQNLMMFAMILMIGYVSVVLSRRDRVESKVLLSFTIVVCVGLSLGVAFGICGYLKIPFTQMSMMTIFIIMGVGIDDMFVITGEFSRTPSHLPSPERVALSLKGVGNSIFYTSVTDFLAFGIGSFIDLPAVSFFCVTAALAVLSVFLVQVTFFAACLSLDGMRIEGDRYDLVPCWKREKWSERNEKEKEQEGIAKEIEEMKEGGYSVCVDFTSFLLKPKVAPCLIFLFLLLGSLMGYRGITTIGKGIKISDFLPEGSYVSEYFEKRDLYFGEIDRIEFITTVDVDVGVEGDRARMDKLMADIEALEQTVGPPDCWYAAFLSYWSDNNGGSIDDAEASVVKSSFTSFQSTPLYTTRYSNAVVLNSGVVSTSKCGSLFYFASHDTDTALLDMDKARAAAGDDAFAFNANYLWMERYRIIDKITMTSLLGCMLGVFTISCLFLDLLSAVLVVVCVILININLLGFMSFWEVRLNVASLVILILSIGFSVDYSAHIAEGYLSHRHRGRSAEEAVVSGVKEMGVSVMNGGISTLLAVLMLSVSKSEGFRVLFKMFLGMVVFGLLHGLVFLPSLFLVTKSGSGMGGKVVEDNSRSEEEAENMAL